MLSSSTHWVEYEQCLGSATNMDAMFFEAEAFNQPLPFNTSKVTSVRVYLFGFQPQWETRFWFPISHQTYYQMAGMFRDAAAFNQNLCHFGDYFSQFSLVDIFGYSGCSNKNVPTSVAGPWCAVTTCYRFTTNSELRTAIQEYLSLEQNCATNVTCQARSHYNGAVSIVLRSSLV